MGAALRDDVSDVCRLRPRARLVGAVAGAGEGAEEGVGHRERDKLVAVAGRVVGEHRQPVFGEGQTVGTGDGRREDVGEPGVAAVDRKALV
ncbi:hypothetical protein N865_06530 [Intrasporangium oryzae NRRL B-24470]|uniref:Uncharacterized protein n=1 Tax=Intrasporangium oryzae NRRL B-24470 TaxID=1386089 RepID=W9G8D4_9MICO|nr:hypothetical protein N865_06530 [Intrasporangium oryzae NRRL B-24470]